MPGKLTTTKEAFVLAHSLVHVRDISAGFWLSLQYLFGTVAFLCEQVGIMTWNPVPQVTWHGVGASRNSQPKLLR